MKLYNLEYKTKEEVSESITWLLKDDRFTCREDSREVRGGNFVV